MLELKSDVSFRELGDVAALLSLYYAERRISDFRFQEENSKPWTAKGAEKGR
jgi:hypothetical protein